MKKLGVNKSICDAMAKYCPFSSKELLSGLAITKSYDLLMVSVNLSLQHNTHLLEECTTIKQLYNGG
jgi:hypothetical protein